jgi:hypothetical protein
MLTLNEQSTPRSGAGQRSALSESAAALTEEQRQIRAALVGYFSILQEWATEEKPIAERAAAKPADGNVSGLTGDR